MTTDPPRPRRSAMYVPAINQRAIAKSRSLDADAAIFDLEDAVAPAMKDAARANLIGAFAEGGLGHRETVIRINAIGSDDFELDLAAAAQCQPAAVLVPKVSDADELRHFTARAGAHRLDPAATLWIMVESTAALAQLDAIVCAGLALAPRLQCLVVGTNDLAKETGVDPGEERRYLLPWLMNVVLVARRRRVCVLDGVWNDFGDQAGFDAEARQSVKMGFDGKTLIHPTQVEPANRAFTPSREAVADAQRIAEAFARPEHAGAGVINLEGRMVERLHLEQALRLLAIDAAIETRRE